MLRVSQSLPRPWRKICLPPVHPQARPANELPSARPGDIARCLLAIGYARIGAPEKVRVLLKAAEPGMKADPIVFDKLKQSVAAGYIAAEKFDEALEMVRREISPEEAPLTLFGIVCGMATSGRIDQAMRHLGELRAQEQEKALYVIVAERVRLGQIDGLAEFIDTQSAPSRRAMLDLAVARQVLGHPYDRRAMNIRPFDSEYQNYFQIQMTFDPNE